MTEHSAASTDHEREPSIFDARLRFWLLSGALIGIALTLLAVLVLTQTRWGHERVLGFTLSQAAERLNGTLEIERLSGNLLTGAKLHGVSLRGPDDDPFILADSAFVEYNLRTIAGDELVLDRIVLYSPEIFLRQLPGDTLWNYDRIFGDTIPPVEPVDPTTRWPVIVRAASLIHGDVTIELPWEPDPALPPAEREREIRAALADTSQVLVREVPGGYLQTMRLSGVDTDLLRVVSAPDELGGTSLHVERLAGEVQVFREPFRVQQLAGDLAYRENVLQFRLATLDLPDSHLAGHGSIEFGHEDGPRLDLIVTGDTIAFTDLQWLYPRLPEEGGGSLQLIIETRPEGTLYLARDLRIVAPGTRLQGSFGLIVSDALRFVDVDLEADPLRVATIEAMLPVVLPVIGLRIGGVEIRQPAT